jgi:hypothetical protein
MVPQLFQYLTEKSKLKWKRGLGPRANYTDRATAACRRSYPQLLRIEEQILVPEYSLWGWGGKAGLERKTDNVTAISLPIVLRMWAPRNVRTLWVSTACYMLTKNGSCSDICIPAIQQPSLYIILIMICCWKWPLVCNVQTKISCIETGSNNN